MYKSIGMTFNPHKHTEINAIVNEISRRKVNMSNLLRDLLREYRDRGYRTEAEWKEAVENGEVETECCMI